MNGIQKEYRESSPVRNVVRHSGRYIADVGLSDEASAITVSGSGIITGCNRSCARLLSCKPGELNLQHISKIFPQIQDEMLFEERHVNPRLSFLSRIGYHFEVVKGNGANFASKLFFVELANTCENYIRVIIRPVELSTRNA